MENTALERVLDYKLDAVLNAYEKVFKNMTPDEIHVRRLPIPLKSGEERFGAFQVVDMEKVGVKLLEIHTNYDLEYTFEMEQLLKPLSMWLRLKYGLSSPGEWLAIEEVFPDKVVPTSGRHYQSYTLEAVYDWVELWSLETRKRRWVPIPIDIVGLRNTNRSVLL